MGAQLAAQRLVQQVGGGVVGADRAATDVVEFSHHRLADQRGAAFHPSEVHEQVAKLLLRVGDHDMQPVGTGDGAGIADLSAAFAIERRLVQHDGQLGADMCGLSRRAIDHQCADLGFGSLGGISQELRGSGLFLDFEPDPLGSGLAGAGPGGAGAGALFLHRRLEAIHVHGAALFPQRVLRQVERKAVGVVETEGDGTRQGLAVAEVGRLLRKQVQAAFQQLLEAGFLQLQGFLYQCFGAHQFGVGGAHLAYQGRDQAEHDGLLRAHQRACAAWLGA